MAGPLPEQHARVLAGALLRGELVLFVGAGLSHLAIARDGSGRRLPLWKELAAQVAEKCQADPKDHKNILDLFSWIQHSVSRGRLEDAIREALNDAGYDPSSAHEALAKLQWAEVCTTNYDNLLGRVLIAERISEEAHYFRLGGPKLVFHIHGTLENPHTLVSDDYQLWSDTNQLAYRHLESVVLSKTVLFVGYSFSDPHLADSILPTVRRISKKHRRLHYGWIWQLPEPQKQLLERRDHIEAVSIDREEQWAAAFQQLAEEVARLRDHHPVANQAETQAGRTAFDYAGSESAVRAPRRQALEVSAGPPVFNGPLNNNGDDFGTRDSGPVLTNQNGKKPELRRPLFTRLRRQTVTILRHIVDYKFSILFCTVAYSLLVIVGWNSPFWPFLSERALQTRLYETPSVDWSPEPLYFYSGRNEDIAARGLDKNAALRFEIDTGVEVKVTNPEPQERFSNIEESLETHSDRLDVILIDAPWVNDLADDLLDLSPYLESDVNKHYRTLVANDTVGGRRHAVPLFLDIGLLFYRQDLLRQYDLKVPETWEDLNKAAKLIQDGERQKNHDFVGFVWQGRDYEGLTCNALEWIASRGGVDSETGQIDFDGPGVLDALEQARTWLGSISREVNTYDEGVSSRMFAAGNAAFLRIWGSEYMRLLKKGAPPFGVAPLPHNVGTLGGWQLAVSKYSRNQRAAVEYVRYLTSRRFKAGVPSRADLYLLSRRLLLSPKCRELCRSWRRMTFVRSRRSYELRPPGMVTTEARRNASIEPSTKRYRKTQRRRLYKRTYPNSKHVGFSERS